MKFTSLLAAAAAGLLLTACGTQSTTSITDNTPKPLIENENKALKIVTTFPPLYAHALNIADENDTVTNLVPAGTSVHFWQPTPQDVATLENADIVVTNGLDLEEFLEDYLDDLEDRGIMIVDTSAHVQTIEFEHDDEDGDEHDDDHDANIHEEDDEHHEDDHDDDHDDHKEEHHDDDAHEDDEEDHDDHHGHHHHHDGVDPHIWLSALNAKEQTEAIAQALINADPSMKSTYAENNRIYQEKLTDLDQHIRTSIASGSVSPFVVFHDAYGYYLHEYGLVDQQVGMVQKDHNDSPSQADIAALIQQIRDAGVTKIFIEPQFSPSIVQAIQTETDVAIREIDPIGSQMDADGYIANMKAITEAFTK